MPRWEEQVTNECSHEPGSDSHTVTAPACAAGTIPRIFPIPSGPRPPSPSALPLYPTYSHAVTLLPHHTSTLSYSFIVDTQAALASLHCEVPIISDVLH